jgi:hypothetical protein
MLPTLPDHEILVRTFIRDDLSYDQQAIRRAARRRTLIALHEEGGSFQSLFDWFLKGYLRDADREHDRRLGLLPPQGVPAHELADTFEGWRAGRDRALGSAA